jgi:hypothetical protein
VEKAVTGLWRAAADDSRAAADRPPHGGVNRTSSLARAGLYADPPGARVRPIKRTPFKEPKMSATHTHIARKELAYRSSNGIDVFLLWNPANDTLAVLVIDENADSFELDVTASEALDAFDHPYAYAAFRGLTFDEVELPAAA